MNTGTFSFIQGFSILLKLSKDYASRILAGKRLYSTVALYLKLEWFSSVFSPVFSQALYQRFTSVLPVFTSVLPVSHPCLTSVSKVFHQCFKKCFKNFVNLYVCIKAIAATQA